MKPTSFQPNRLYLLPLVGLLVFPAFRDYTAADEPEASDDRHVAGWVRLSGGDHLGGRLRGSSPADALVWDHQGFSTPFRFDLAHVVGAAFPSPKKNTDPKADDTPDSGRGFVVELNGDDRL